MAGGATGIGIGSLTGMLQGGLKTLVSMGWNLLDRILPPDRREDIKQKLVKFATEKPYLASFLLSQIAISGIPMFLFVTMTVTVAVFALVAGLLVGLLGAILFILVAVGFALAILFPTLFFTTFAAVGIWLWGMGAYYIIKWFNKKEVPGVHVPMSDDLKKATGLDNLTSGLNLQAADPKPQPKEHVEQPQANGTSEKHGTGHKKKHNQGQTPQQHLANGQKELIGQLQNSNPIGKDQSLPNPTKSLGL